MRQEDWTSRLRERLADYEQPVPQGAWEEIEKALPARQRPRRAVLAPWLAAAAVALLLGGVGMVYMNRSQSGKELPVAKAVRGGEEPSDGKVAETMAAPVAATVPRPPVREVLAAAAPATAPARVEAMAGSEAPADSILQPVERKEPTATDGDKRHPQPNSPSAGMHPRQQPAYPPEKSRRRKASGWEVGLLAANGMAGNSNSASNVRMSDQMLLDYMGAGAGYQNANGIGMERATPVYLVDYEERTSHKMPVQIGLAVSYRLGRRWAVETGVAYMRTSSAFTKQVRQQTLTTEQTLHYVGIPLRLSYMAWQKGRLRVYASGGGEADANVKARRTTEGLEQPMKKDRMLFSVQAAAGVQMNVLPQVGIYAEPGLKYYFDNGSGVDNIFKDTPLQPSLQVGVRWNVK